MSTPSSRRWWIGGAAAFLVLAAVAGAAVFLFSGRRSTEQASGLPGLPDQLLLAAPMTGQPRPGWHLRATDLGLAPGTFVRPVGNHGSKGSFLGLSTEGWWVLGIDVNDGRRTFGPVRLGPSENAQAFECFANGPDAVLCVRQDRDAATPNRTWVVNTETGAMLFDGPTDLRLAPADGHPTLVQVGNYVVATVPGQGVHGVGRQGQLTWFVPGSGLLSSATGWNRDIESQSWAALSGVGDDGDVVFSSADGAVFAPSVPEGDKLGRAVVYPNGIGYEYRSVDAPVRVAFFDFSGRPLAWPDGPGSLRLGSADIPLVETESDDIVMTVTGRRLMAIAKSALRPYARLIGTRLFVTSDESRRVWQQYDLQTARLEKDCENEAFGYGYIGSDGKVAVTLGPRSPAQAMDLATCATLWSTAASTPSMSTEVFRVNTTLLQRNNDELFALVAGR